MKIIVTTAVVALISLFSFSASSNTSYSIYNPSHTYQDTTKKETKTKKEKKAKEPDKECGKMGEKQLYKGPKGGCYYLNDKGKKTYVDKSNCNC